MLPGATKALGQATRKGSHSKPCGHTAQGDGDQPPAQSQLRGEGLGSRGQSWAFTCTRRGGKRLQPHRQRRAQPDAGGSAAGMGKEGNSPPHRVGTRRRQSEEEPRGWGVTCRQ
ncbi:hypothetical protein KIL84_010637 [Mauremys mutica]|uniref:Uncharacterized protein n=1 Tax=Mauremys mutica TaxID=74926 RepID=A0A9D3XCZ3_9SAUR|nr:hypothetical protein KIL84_010637 [Mauremys mutica]